jgi:hypothetical protein
MQAAAMMIRGRTFMVIPIGGMYADCCVPRATALDPHQSPAC